MKTFYHITKIEKKERIIKEGLIPKNGKIYLFEDGDIHYPEGLYRFDKWTNNMRLIPVEAIIAKLELFLPEYSLFKVTIDMETYPDDSCGEERVQMQQVYVKEPIKNVEYIGDFTIGHFWEYPLLKEKFIVPAGHKVIHMKKGAINFGFAIV